MVRLVPVRGTATALVVLARPGRLGPGHPALSLEQPGDGGRLGEAARLVAHPRGNHPPQLLQRLQEELQNAHARRWAAPRDGLAWVLEDPSVCEVHLALLPPATAPNDPLRLHRLDGLQLKVRYQGLQALAPREKRELLLDADSIRNLKMELRPAQGIYPTQATG